MPTRQKLSSARKFLEDLNGGPLTFGQLVESNRKGDGITQADLARRLNISRSQLCDIEKGRTGVSAKRAAAFARVLGWPENVFVAIAIEDQLREAGLALKVTLSAA